MLEDYLRPTLPRRFPQKRPGVRADLLHVKKEKEKRRRRSPGVINFEILTVVIVWTILNFQFNSKCLIFVNNYFYRRLWIINHKKENNREDCLLYALFISMFILSYQSVTDLCILMTLIYGYFKPIKILKCL